MARGVSVFEASQLPSWQLLVAAGGGSILLSVVITFCIVLYRRKQEEAKSIKAATATGSKPFESGAKPDPKPQRPSPHFKIELYTGKDAPLEPASNMLLANPNRTHRTLPGGGVEQDLVLTTARPEGAPSEFDRIQVMGAMAGDGAGAANALKTGLVWVFKTKADMPDGFVEEGLKKFSGFNRELFDEYDKALPDAPSAFFETKVPEAARDARPPSCSLVMKDTVAEVVVIKFLTTHGEASNVCVASIIFHQEEDDEPSAVGGFRLGRHLGSGGFGDVFAGVCEATKEKVAIKIEQEDVIKSVIRIEAAIIMRLNPEGKMDGFPRVMWRGSNCFVMDLMGPSVEDLLQAMPGRKFTLKTTLLLADEMLKRLQHLHRRSYVHRDVKPDNFIFGLDDKKNVLHMCDFGLSARYRDRTTGQHIRFLEGRSVYGTPYFVSINAHRGVEQTTRDDLEALGYCLVYFVKGTLPWLGMRGQGVRRSWHARVMEKKATTKVKVLCEGLPKEFTSYLTYVRGLSFGEFPDYDYCRSLFHMAYAREGFEVDEPRIYDWTEVGKDWTCWTDAGAPPRWTGSLGDVRTRDDMPEACVRDAETLPTVVGK